MATVNPNPAKLTSPGTDPQWLEAQAERSLERLLPRLEQSCTAFVAAKCRTGEQPRLVPIQPDVGLRLLCGFIRRQPGGDR